LKLADKYLLGIPDICIVYAGETSWWELKVWRESREPKLTDFGKGVQLNMLQRLASESLAFYIVFIDRPKDKRIWIAEPDNIQIDAPREFLGHDYELVAQFIADRH
jgi:hypothetical protein